MHLLMEVREEHVIFGPPAGGANAPPAIHEDALWVEGCVVAKFDVFTGKVDRFLTWGAAFTTFAQRLSFRATRNAAYLFNVHVPTEHRCVPPQKASVKSGSFFTAVIK